MNRFGFNRIIYSTSRESYLITLNMIAKINAKFITNTISKVKAAWANAVEALTPAPALAFA